jgi:hypothetical protein
MYSLRRAESWRAGEQKRDPPSCACGWSGVSRDEADLQPIRVKNVLEVETWLRRLLISNVKNESVPETTLDIRSLLSERNAPHRTVENDNFVTVGTA